MPTAVTPKVLSEAQQENSRNREVLVLDAPPVFRSYVVEMLRQLLVIGLQVYIKYNLGQ